MLCLREGLVTGFEQGILLCWLPGLSDRPSLPAGCLIKDIAKPGGQGDLRGTQWALGPRGVCGRQQPQALKESENCVLMWGNRNDILEPQAPLLILLQNTGQFPPLPSNCKKSISCFKTSSRACCNAQASRSR